MTDDGWMGGRKAATNAILVNRCAKGGGDGEETLPLHILRCTVSRFRLYSHKSDWKTCSIGHWNRSGGSRMQKMKSGRGVEIKAENG